MRLCVLARSADFKRKLSKPGSLAGLDHAQGGAARREREMRAKDDLSRAMCLGTRCGGGIGKTICVRRVCRKTFIQPTTKQQLIHSRAGKIVAVQALPPKLALLLSYSGVKADATSVVRAMTRDLSGRPSTRACHGSPDASVAHSLNDEQVVCK
jgi:hypothetical protein